MPEEKPAAKSNSTMRVVLIVLLVVVLILAIGQGKLRGDNNKALDLYEEATAMGDTGDIAARTAKLQEAESLLESVVQNPLSIIRLRGQAKKSLGQVKLQLAVDRGLNTRIAVEYAEVVKMLEAAQKLDPSSQEIKNRLAEYQLCLTRAREAALPPLAGPEE